MLTAMEVSTGEGSWSFTWEEKDSSPGRGTGTACVCCCCRWVSWLRIGDGSGWDLKSGQFGKRNQNESIKALCATAF